MSVWKKINADLEAKNVPDAPESQADSDTNSEQQTNRRIGNRLIIPEESAKQNDEILEVIPRERVIIIPPTEARRLGLTPLLPDDPDDILEIEPVSGGKKPASKKRKKARKRDPLKEPLLTEKSVLDATHAPPLDEFDELVADYIALHTYVDPAQIDSEFKADTIDISAALQKLMAHGLIVRHGQSVRPAPDLAKGGAALINSYLDPVLSRLSSVEAQTAWQQVVENWAGDRPGYWHSTKTQLVWTSKKKKLLTIQVAKTQVRLNLKGDIGDDVDLRLTDALRENLDAVELKETKRDGQQTSLIFKGTVNPKAVSHLLTQLFPV
jgi:hypothetical protein